MPLRHVTADILQSQEQVLAHGVNCRGGWGGGISGVIGRAHPQAEEAYRTKHAQEGWTLGEVQMVKCDGRIVANCATQDRFGPPPTVYADYDAIAVVMETLAGCGKSVAMPRIGAGLAGGEWQRIVGLIETAFASEGEATIYTWPPP